MTTETITEQGHRHGSEYADYTWQLDPADYDMALEWCHTANAGTLHDYHLPGAFDETPADLDTAGWSWGELADYEGAWTQGYLARTTELCRIVIDTEHCLRHNDKATA